MKFTLTQRTLASKKRILIVVRRVWIRFPYRKSAFPARSIVITCRWNHNAVNVSFLIRNFSLFLQIKRDPHQRIVYRPYDTSPTLSSLEMRASSPLLQKVFYSAPKNKLQQSVNVTCEVSILDVYKSDAHTDLLLINPTQTSFTPNLLGLERASGDPDNSALTGASPTQFAFCYVIFYVLVGYVLSCSAFLWRPVG